MQLKTAKKGNVIVEIYDDYIPKEKEKYKINLANLYDTINYIYKDKDKTNLFYTLKELELLKKSKPELFI